MLACDRNWRGLAHYAIASLLALLVWVMSVAVTGPAPAGTSSRASINAYRGLGSWVDIYDTAQWDSPVATVKKMKRKGVRTLFLETGNYHSGPPIFRPADVDRFIHAAHRRNMKVVAWYLPSFVDPGVDFRRSLAAIRYRTARNQRFDGFGLDIEATLVKSISERKQRMLRLSRRIRNAVGERYPLSAIIPSPYGMKRVPGYWGPVRDFPWARLARIYDVIVPMSYFSWRTSGLRNVYSYNAYNIRLIRRESGDPEVPIHLIGGIAEETSRDDIRGYVRAIRTFGAPGGSLYAFDGTRRRHWQELKKIPVNPRQSPPLPVKLRKAGWSAAIGNVPGSDRSHPKEVYFKIGRRSGPIELEFEGFDIGEGEVELQVNWRSAAELAPTASGAWGESQTFKIARWRLRSDRPNFISFVARGDFPRWSTWGVRNVQAAEVER